MQKTREIKNEKLKISQWLKIKTFHSLKIGGDETIFVRYAVAGSAA